MEKPANVPTILRTPLRAQHHAMPCGQIAGVAKKISRLVMGVDNITFAPHCAVLWDDFFEHGGTAFDCAHIYGGGACEKALGAWVNARGVREQVVILDKGAHTPWCTPEWLTRQHHESLERLATDYVDIYMMHRDNVDVPVAEFVEVLHEHVSAGTMRAIGVSNWTLPRVQAFNEYAKTHGMTPLVAISNNFSLARMIEAPWAGCVSSNEPSWRGWHERSQTPLFAWSSQARGFFVEGNAAPEKRDDAELARCWYSEDNFKRLTRARELATAKGVSAINIALA
jgi:aryl-alcohol dehydrogenase-like predicted oxidoreductase